MSLTPKQQRFVAEYLANGMIATTAYIAAGYSKNGAAESASALLRNPKVAEVIAAKTGKRLAKLEVKADYVFESILSTMERCKQAEQVTYRGEPVPGQYQFDAHGVLKGAELLGRHLKLWTDRVEVEDVSDPKQKLKALVEKRRKSEA